MMKTLIMLGVLALALFTITLTPTAKASEFDKKTVITIKSGSVQIQGTVLEPGKYILKLVESPSDRRILQVFNSDETKLKTTVLANSAYRAKPADNTMFTYYEMSPGQPLAVRTWFYPGDNYGLEFSRR